jgi:hypothetical protein
MKRLFGIGIMVLMTTAVGAGGGPASTDAANAFARLRTLAGEWDASLANGETAHLSIELIAAGSALLERETGGNRPVMTTMYHRDGDRLLLTHYCMAGNQPRMQARPLDETKNELAFDFVDATNMPNAAAGHMHSLTIRFIDSDHVETTWQFFENGKPTMNEKARYTRAAR